MFRRVTSSYKELAADKAQDFMVKAETGLLHHRRMCGVVLAANSLTVESLTAVLESLNKK